MMAEINILKTDARGRITLPAEFRKEPLFEYVIKGDQIILYPVRTVRKYPDMSDLPAEELSSQWVAREKEVNADRRSGIQAATPAEAIKKRRK
jgi:bifunctional DNA-binding transcriptional regulator/antitoxin component of YhaV-PrlF toxin-antitoxin module